MSMKEGGGVRSERYSKVKCEHDCEVKYEHYDVM